MPIGRRIIYIKNPTEGSHFRQLGGNGTPGSKPHYSYPFKPQSPTKAPTSHGTTPGTRAVHGGGGFLQALNPLNNVGGLPQYNASTKDVFASLGIASFADWQQAISEMNLPSFNVFNLTIGANPVSWTEFMFQNTIFDGTFTFGKTAFGGSSDGISSEDYYYQVAENAGVEAPPPQWGVPSVGETIQRSIWDAMHPGATDGMQPGDLMNTGDQ